MKVMPVAGLIGLAAWGVEAQVLPTPSPLAAQSLLVTATRGIAPADTLRDTVVITREEIESSGALSLGELLERRAGIQLRATGGPGQPQGLFIRGAGTAQTLVLVDGLRVGSATVGTTSIENIPLEMIERIEVVKGALSSLYGSEAIGGVVQVFTRGKGVPHLFGAAAYGTDQDQRVSAGLTAADRDTAVSLSMGARKVDAPSAGNARHFCPDADRDPYENGFANVRASHQLWQGETIGFEGFVTYGRTAFDGCGDNDRNDQQISSARLTSSNNFAPWWASRVTLGEGRDRLVVHGAFPGRIETRQQQGTWINEFTIPAGKLVAGAETVRQKVLTDDNAGAFTRNRRDVNSAFLALDENWRGQHLEASVRYDDDDTFGKRTTGSASYGFDWPRWGRLAATYARGFRAPTFFDLYGPSSEFYRPNPQLAPERSRTREVSLRSLAAAPFQWRVTAFDNRIEGLIVYVFPTVENLSRARIRGVEAALEAVRWDTRWRASVTAQRPEGEDGRQLPGRSKHYGSLEATRAFGAWTVGISAFAAGERFDAVDESPERRLPAYAVVDARVRYRFARLWSVELSATNLLDKRYENAVGFDAPRRSVLLSVRFDAF